MKRTCQQAALTYLQKFGFSVIPVKQDKTPFVKWEPFQKRKATSEEVNRWWTEYPGAMIGIVTGRISGVVVVDIDTSEGEEAIQQYIPDSLVTPTARTPRGGQHLYFRCPENPPSNNARLIPGCDFRGEGGYVIAPPSRNGNGRGYEWVLSIEHTPLAHLPEPYRVFINSLALGGYKGGFEGEYTKAHEGTEGHKILTLGRRDNDLFHVANCLVRGHTPSGEVSQYLEILAKSCDPPFPLSEIREKIKSALNRVDRRERNLAQEVRQWVESTEGHFESTQLHREAHLSTKEEMHAVNMALQRLVKEGVLEKYGDKRGAYRRVEKECDPIDFLHASGQTIDLRWPFGIERHFKTLPKNIAMVAGESEAGKTALLLNFTRMNMTRHKIHYFSSEMGALEMQMRMSKFDLPLDQWTFDPRERASNFADVIDPEDVNVIDFLEIHDEFYRIGAMIKEIFDKLKGGIAVIALQKNKNTDYGLGGMRSVEKARLYLAMEPGKIKIMKAKNWATEVNPNGLICDFKLVQGCKFIVQRDWYRG